LAIANDAQFRRFAKAAGIEHLAEDARFKTNADRVQHRETLIPQLQPVFAARKTADWIALLEAANVPCGPINRVDQVFADPQAIARGLTISMAHATGPLDLVASPLKLAKTPPDYRLPPPLLGEHTDEVLREVLELEESVVRSLREKSVIA
jgi:crotonobetainyl-CoA:carnitine CoA-transferase CaiB-like acyl-CoA transferase